MARTSGSTPCPTTTSYGDAPRTSSVVTSAMDAILHHGPHPLGDLPGREPVGVHDVRRDRLVDRRTLVEELLDPATDVAEQQRPRHPESHALRSVTEASAEEDDTWTLEQVAVRRIEHCTCAQGEHPWVGGERLRD